MTNGQLSAHLEMLLSEQGRQLSSEMEPCLCEMASRKMQTELQEHHEQFMASSKDPEKPWEPPDNLPILTALRRAQGQSDPLKIHVELEPDYRWNREAIDVLAVVSNQDPGKEAFYYWSGGDDRSGRRTRWRIHLFDESGQRLPDSDFHSSLMGGGIGGVGPLAFGDRCEWQCWFDARNYVQAPRRSGNYRLQLVHGTEDIANQRNLTGLICYTSDPINVRVTVPWYDWRGRRFLVEPLLIILTVSIFLAGSLYARSFRKGLSGPQMIQLQRAKKANLIALAVLNLLAWCWYADQSYLRSSIKQLQGDAQANWSMELDK